MPAKDIDPNRDPRTNTDNYRRCLGEFGTGVTVVTTCVGERFYGMTANSFSSVSLEPPLVLWSVKRSSQSFDAFELASHFTVNILASDQIVLSRHFGKPGEDKFSTVAWEPGIHAGPVLSNAAASFECRRVAAYDGGDHLIIVGEVERFARSDREVLLFVQGRYGVAREHPEALAAFADKQTRDNQVSAPGPTNDLMAGLMYRAYGALSIQMERIQRLEGLNPVKGRLMGAIATYPGRTLEELSPELFLGMRTAERNIEEMREAGIVSISDKGELELTELGHAKLKKISAEIEYREIEMMAGLDKGDISATRRLLRHLISQSRRVKSA